MYRHKRTIMSTTSTEASTSALKTQLIDAASSSLSEACRLLREGQLVAFRECCVLLAVCVALAADRPSQRPRLCTDSAQTRSAVRP